jgi:hypothetical protein
MAIEHEIATWYVSQVGIESTELNIAPKRYQNT